MTMDKEQRIENFRRMVYDKIRANEKYFQDALNYPDDTYNDIINKCSNEQIIKVLKGEEAPEIDRFLQEYPIVTILEKDYQNKFKQKYKSIGGK